MNSTAVVALIQAVLCATTSAYLLTWVARMVAPRWGFVDRPDGGRKRHSRATPLMGGLAIFVSFSLTLAACAHSQAVALFDPLPMFVLLVSGSLFCLLGLWDDRRPLSARNKFLFQILASLPFAIWGTNIHAIHCLGMQLQLGPLALPFTVLWLVSCANVVNLVDGLDGLASTFGLIAVVTLAILSALNGYASSTAVSLIFAASIVGFLAHNWPPAKIFLGDAGSLMIGFMVGAMSTQASLKSTTGFMLAFPLVVLSVPIMDTLMAILRRKLTGRSIGEADHAHIHHRLQDKGLTKLQTLLAITGFTAAMAGTTVAASVLQADYVAVLTCLGVVVILIGGRIFGFQETILVFRHLEVINSTLTDALYSVGPRFSLARIGIHGRHDLDRLWASMRSEVESCGCAALTFVCRRANRTLVQRKWANAHIAAQEGTAWEIRYVVEREDGSQALFTASGAAAGSRGGHRLDQLLRVFDAFGKHWPTDVSEVRPLSPSVLKPVIPESVPAVRPHRKAA